MRILLIRHADPDYERDSLTETGWREAELLARRLEREKLDFIYTSPLGRARDTASLTLKALGREAETLDWLREFQAPIWRPDDKEEMHICWDWLPADWLNDPLLYDAGRWFEHPVMAEGNVKVEYDRVCAGLDELLAAHGYVREGHLYRAERANHDTLALFCHFGVGCVLLSRLLRVSPMVLWHGLCAAPASVTTVLTEERREGTASFRVWSYGDVSHILAAGETPSFSARFCECFTDDTRHD